MVTSKRRRKKETYYDRWRREHPRLQMYLNREEYEWLKREAEARGLSMKEFVLEIIRKGYNGYKEGYDKGYREGFDDGFNEALDKFILDPWEFYKRIIERVKKLGLKGFEPALFTIPCKYCGRPMVFTHKNENWGEIRETLYQAFSRWAHTKCIEEARKQIAKALEEFY